MIRFRGVRFLIPFAALLLLSGGTGPRRPGRLPALVTVPPILGPADEIAALITAKGLAAHRTETGGFLCLELPGMAFCLDPNTDPARAEELLGRLPIDPRNWGKANFDAAARWTITALNSSTGVRGDPVTITWGFLPDGVNIPGAAGEPSSPNDLHAVFDAHIPTATWQQKIRSALAQWGAVTGLSYVEVAYDDGASFPNSPGVDGVRPDVRIGGHPIDGWGGILAYNEFPNGGDMVIDTDDWRSYDNTGGNYRFLRNVVAHEHGHGIGLGHVIPTDQTKLMEPYVSTAYDGVQDDDIRGGMRNYGDWLENNDDPASATDLGDLASPATYTDLSIDKGASDTDWFLVTAPGGGNLTVTVTPVGSTYDVGPQGGTTSTVNTLAISDPEINIYDATGTTLLTTQNTQPSGSPEVLSAYPVAPGATYIQIRRADGTGGGVQRYTFSASLDVSTSIAGNVGAAPAAEPIEISLRPNPFNPVTRIVLGGMPAFAGRVSIYDIAGREVRRFDRAGVSTDAAQFDWDGTDQSGRALPSGVYFVRVSTDAGEAVRRAYLIR